MPQRLRGTFYYNPGSGMGAWLEGQLGVRLGICYDLHTEAPDRTPEPTRVSRNGEKVIFDLIFEDGNEALAIDTWNTITAPSVLAHVRAANDAAASHVELHECTHEDAVPAPCEPTHAWRAA